MNYTRSFAFALVVFSVACGSNGGPGDVPDVDPESPAYDSEAPARNPEAPRGIFDSPQTTATEQPAYPSEGPPVPESPGGGGGSNQDCDQVCASLLEAGCEEGDPATCSTACPAALAELGACSEQYLVLLDCVFSDPQFACVNGEIDEETFFAQCQGPATAFAACIDREEPDPEPVDECSIEGGCLCATECDRCLCFFEGDTTTCAPSCGG